MRPSRIRWDPAKTSYLRCASRHFKVHKDTVPTTASPKLSHRVPALEMKRKARSKGFVSGSRSRNKLFKFGVRPLRLRLPRVSWTFLGLFAKISSPIAVRHIEIKIPPIITRIPDVTLQGARMLPIKQSSRWPGQLQSCRLIRCRSEIKI